MHTVLSVFSLRFSTPKREKKKQFKTEKQIFYDWTLYLKWRESNMKNCVLLPLFLHEKNQTNTHTHTPRSVLQ